MRKTTVWLAAVLMCAWVSSFAQSNGLPQWKVVKEFHVVGASSGIAQTVLFTAEKNNVYRLSGVASAQAQQESDNTYFSAYWSWTDRAGNETGTSVGFYFYHGSNKTDMEIGRTFSPKVGTSVGFLLQVSDPPPPTATYDLVFTVEKLTR